MTKVSTYWVSVSKWPVGGTGALHDGEMFKVVSYIINVLHARTPDQSEYAGFINHIPKMGISDALCSPSVFPWELNPPFLESDYIQEVPFAILPRGHICVELVSTCELRIGH